MTHSFSTVSPVFLKIGVEAIKISKDIKKSLKVGKIFEKT